MRPFFEIGAKRPKWTPRAFAVMATAKELASRSGRHILASDLLLALECGDHEVSRVFRQLGLSPSAAFGHAAPEKWSLKTELSWEDFDRTLHDLPQFVFEEAAAMNDSHLGIEHLLLSLARVGVAGIDLPHDRIKQTWLESMGRS